MNGCIIRLYKKTGYGAAENRGKEPVMVNAEEYFKKHNIRFRRATNVLYEYENPFIE